jgi:hypothetical protein
MNDGDGPREIRSNRVSLSTISKIRKRAFTSPLE